jgi:molecular chaperone DnaK
MYLGIDLGTSNSAIAGNDGRDIRVFKTADGYDVLPSAIMIDRRGAMFVGKRAYEQDAFSPENVGKRFKRLMGTTSPLSFKSAGRTMTPEEASSEILKALLAQARMSAGEFVVDGAIVTIPAAFNQMQCEATMRAAGMAGIERIGLLQEPIAAAMASIADRQRANSVLKDGQFLVYDLGGGTFDVAIVQSVGGTVNIVGHGGVNMLGGSDFDRSIVNSVVRPWLMDQFDLPSDFQKEPAYARVLRIAAFFSEEAKIKLSAEPSTTISADESQIGTRDRAGREMYLDIPLTRAQVEGLVVDQIDRSIEVCRKLLTENGYDTSDIDRVVFIGGPTRMPIVRSRVPEQLGIAADLNSDPMTAVAFGAAIFAESRDWKGGTSTAKKSRTTIQSQGPVNIEYGYPERTSDNRVRIRVRPGPGVTGRGYRLQIDSDTGWTSGQLALDDTSSINDVPVGRRGENHFRVVVFDGSGTPIRQAETRFVVIRTDATAAGTPLTHTISVKVVEGPAGAERNTLEALIEKGHPLPANGVKDFRAANDLKPGDGGTLDFEVYESELGVSDPKLSLHVGAFRLPSTDLERGEIIRRGDRVRVYWSLDENQLLDCELEIEGKGIGRRFKTGKMFTQQGAQKNFEGKEGEALARTVLDTAQAELVELEKTLGSRAADEAAELANRIGRQRQNLKASYEADTNRSIAEEARSIRQDISKIKDRRENVSDVLRAELESLVAAFDGAIRPSADSAALDRFDRLARQTRDSIARGNIDDAKKSISEMRATCFDEARKQPGFVIDMFLELARERHFAVDKALHDRLVEAGKASIDRNDLYGLRAVIGQILENRYPIDVKDSPKVALAGLMKW